MSYPDIPRDFGFGEEHEILRRSARRFLDERCPTSEVRRLAGDPLGHDPGLWKEMAGLGWTGLVLPEEHGGAGLGALHLSLLLEEMGRRLLPSPFLGTTLAGIALARCGSASQRARWCPALASGETIGSFAFAEPDGSWEPDHVAARAEAVGGGFVLRGAKAYVPAVPSAGLVIAPFREEGGAIALFAVELPAAGVSVEPEIGVDPTRRTGRVSFDGVRVPAEARLEREALREVFTFGYALLAAEAVGGADAALQITRDYAAQRVQFERSIGSFQAVKHPLVNVMIAVESARTLAYGAAAALDQGPELAEVPARMAKAAASDAFAFAVNRAVQLHGGFGFTWDCDAHLYFKRALWTRSALGDGVHHRRHLAEALLGPPT